MRQADNIKLLYIDLFCGAGGTSTGVEKAMSRCIYHVLTSDAIYLDHGWTASKGCNLEYRAAKIYGKQIFEHDKL